MTKSNYGVIIQIYMSLRICSIASGSKGNCIFVSSERTSLILDMGVCTKRVNAALDALGAPPVRDVLLTHAHSDHFRYIPDAVKKGATLHYNRVLRGSVADKLDCAADEFCGDIHIGDITVSAFPVSHDVPCFGYSFYSEGSKVSVVTDLGIMPKTTLESIADSDAVLLESNYDSTMLRENPTYPTYLKARISSNRGHLSNGESAECAAFLASRGVRNILLGHLSEQNNTPRDALAAAFAAMKKYNLEGKARLSVAVQHEMSEVIEV